MMVRLKAITKTSPSGYRLTLEVVDPDRQPPVGAESRLLWDMGQAVHRYVERVFDAGILCPFQGAPEDAPERSE